MIHSRIHTLTLLIAKGLPRNSGGRGSSAVERATPGEEVPGSISAVAARSLLVGSVSVLCDRLKPALSHVWQHVKLSDALFPWGPSAI